MPVKLIGALPDVAVRNAKLALREGVPVDGKLYDGGACSCWCGRPITGVSPKRARTLSGLAAYVRRCKRLHADSPYRSFLIDQMHWRCLAGVRPFVGAQSR